MGTAYACAISMHLPVVLDGALDLAVAVREHGLAVCIFT